MSSLIDLSGKSFGDWSVIGKTHRPGIRVASAYWLCRCKCGTERAVDSAKLRTGKSTGCGCGRKSHGASGTRTYNSWNSMHQRCNDEDSYAYGMKIAARWCGRNGFKNFLKDMGERPAGMSLDRIDGGKGYTPKNCRWATRRQQTENRGVARMVVLDGVAMTFGRAYELMHAALRDGKATFIIQTSAYEPRP